MHDTHCIAAGFGCPEALGMTTRHSQCLGELESEPSCSSAGIGLGKDANSLSFSRSISSSPME